MLIEKKEPDYLYHYTNFAGLEGILKDGCLRATDYLTTNDASELRWAQKFIVRKIGSILNNELLAARIIDCISKVAIKGIVKGIFITSFCSATDPWIEKDGLLSQWRAYGSGAGYAIKFGKKRLEEILKSEGEEVSISEVKYYHEEEQDKFESNFKEQLEMIEMVARNIKERLNKEQKITKEVLGKIAAEEIANIFADKELLKKSVYEVICSCKHYSFHEENEYRITYIHFTEGQGVKIETYNKNGILRNYTRLFESKKFHRTIKEIIVGPSLDKENNADKLFIMLESLGLGHIEVSKSTIPFI